MTGDDAYPYAQLLLPFLPGVADIGVMTIRGKEINLGGPLLRLLTSEDPVAQRLRATVAVGFFLAYLATALIS